jgi:hypothetical protein
MKNADKRGFEIHIQEGKQQRENEKGAEGT